MMSALLTRPLAAAILGTVVPSAACTDYSNGPSDNLTPETPVLVSTVEIPPQYGIHDTYVRDGIAFVCAWNTGVIIYDVGDGRRSGSPSNPVEIGRLVTNDNGVPGGPAVHNAWWFHNPTNGEKRYLFIGQEGPASLFNVASGDLHVVDVSDLANPREVASLRIPGAGVHNFWMDESRQLLYAAWYNAGVIAVDVSGTLAGDLTPRIRAQARPGNDETFVWGVMLANGALWVSDIVSGFWKLDPTTLATIGGGRNVPERYGADLWVRGEFGYTGTWGGSGRNGNGYGDVIKVWRVGGSGGPVLADSVKIAEVRTISDLQVSDDGRLLVATTERLAKPGFSVFDLADPAKPRELASVVVPDGLHTGTVATIGGRLYLFGAKNPPNPALRIYELAR
jgi:hypothetical protein